MVHNWASPMASQQAVFLPFQWPGQAAMYLSVFAWPESAVRVAGRRPSLVTVRDAGTRSAARAATAGEPGPPCARWGELALRGVALRVIWAGLL